MLILLYHKIWEKLYVLGKIVYYIVIKKIRNWNIYNKDIIYKTHLSTKNYNHILAKKYINQKIGKQ